MKRVPKGSYTGQYKQEAVRPAWEVGPAHGLRAWPICGRSPSDSELRLSGVVPTLIMSIAAATQ